MSDDPPPLIVADGDAAAQRSLVDDVRQVIDDGRTLVEAEIAYQTSRAKLAGAGAKAVAAWGGLAVALVFFALMALVLGVVIGVALWVSPLAALIGVPLGLAALAALAGMVAARRWKAIASQLSESGSDE